MKNKLTVEGIKATFEYLDVIETACNNLVDELSKSGHLKFYQNRYDRFEDYDDNKILIYYNSGAYYDPEESNILIPISDLVDPNVFIEKFKKDVDIKREEAKKKVEAYNKEMELKQLEYLKNKYN